MRRAIQMVEVACGMPSLMMGDSLNDVSRGIDCTDHPPAARRVRGHYAVQFSRHGADVDVPVRHRLREHFHAEAVRKSSDDADAHRRNCCMTAGVPAGVFNLIHGDKVAVDALLHHPLVRAISFRRIDAGGQVHLRDRSETGQTRAGAGRREKSPGGDAGRRIPKRRWRPSSARRSARRASAAWPAACWFRWAMPPSRCWICWSRRPKR